MKSKPENNKNKIREEVRDAAKAESSNGTVRVPEKKPLKRAVRPPAEYPVDALGDRLTPVALALADVTQAPIEACAQLALSVANIAVQGLADVAMPHGVRPVSLNFLAVMPSGERKSAVFGAALQGVYRFEARLRREYAAAEEAKKCNKNFPMPPLPIVTITESTIDGMAKFLTQSRGSVLVATDEGAIFSNSHSMAQKDLMRTLGLWSSCWDGTPQKMVRAATDHRMITGVRVAMSLMAQPPAVAKLLTNDEARAQGLLGRFLMCMPPSLVGERFYRAPSAESLAVLDAFHERVFATLKLPLPLAKGERNGLSPRRITLSPQAIEVFAAFHDEIEAKVVEGKRYFPVREFACKAAEHAARLSASIALYHNRNAETVTAARMADGVTLARFYLAEALRIASAEGDADLQIAEKALSWITRRERDVVGLSCLYRLGPPEIRKASTARKIAKILVEHGYLAEVEGGVDIDGKLCEGYLVL